MIETAILTKIIGTENVICEDAKLNEYARDMSFVSPVKPACIIKPRNTSELEKIIKLANETATPLVPVSSGTPHFRGDTVPSIGGAVIVDLSGMKKIIRVYRSERVAMCEPGVTFGELLPAAEKEGLRLIIPLLPRQSKSVVGSMLEREPVIIPKYHWDISDPIACMEVVFGTGDVFRTGSASGPGTIEQQWATGRVQKTPIGPSQASLHRVVQGSQGTMGIVTWASMRCEVLPQIEKPFFVGSTELGKIMEAVHWLIRLRLVDECFVLNNIDFAAIMAKNWPGNFREIRDGLPRWLLFFSVAGYEYLPEQRVETQTRDVMEVLKRAGLVAEESINQIFAKQLLGLTKRPSEEPYWKLRYKGASQDIFFLALSEDIPGLIEAMNRLADDAGYPVTDIGIYIQPIVQGTNYHCEFNLFYNSDDKKESEVARELVSRAATELTSRGAFFSRPYGEEARLLCNKDAGTMIALKKVKSILDPNNVMNPGKLYF
jgi:FAD/FMN-containing dehydrogenase